MWERISRIIPAEQVQEVRVRKLQVSSTYHCAVTIYVPTLGHIIMNINIFWPATS